MILIVVVAMLFVGCAGNHCSRTVTNFTGKTKGFNPYGDGDMDMDRESYWGNLGCIKKLIDKVYPMSIEPIKEGDAKIETGEDQLIDFADVLREALDEDGYADE